MPTYLFRCDQCGKELNEYHDFSEDTFAIIRACDQRSCEGSILRVVTSARFKRGLPDGYYPSIGGYARSKTDLQSQLSRKSDEDAHRLGHDVSYKIAEDPTPEFFGVTEEGLDSTQRERVKSGQQEVKKFY